MADDDTAEVGTAVDPDRADTPHAIRFRAELGFDSSQFTVECAVTDLVAAQVRATGAKPRISVRAGLRPVAAR